MTENIPRTPEILIEASPEIIPVNNEKEITFGKEEKSILRPAEPLVSPKSDSAALSVIAGEPTIMQHKIEHILEEDMSPLFMQLSQSDQLKFKTLGETTALKITNLLQQTKVRLGEILSLIKQWLSSITGINKFYVEQEAKIKAEKILNLRQEK